MRYTLLLTVAALVLGVSCGQKAEQGGTPGAGATYSGTAQNLGGLTVRVPEGWTSQPPTSSMRAAQYVLPGAEGAGSAELAVFYFGAGSAGSVEANLERWRGQVTTSDGSRGDVTKHEVNGMPVTVLDVTGTYSASMGPMMQSSSAVPDTRMVAAIVESPTGAYYFKLTGPKATVGAWRETFTGFVNSSQKP